MRTRSAQFALICLAASIGFAEPAANDSGFTAVFNGKDLDGWKAQAHAFWTVENGEIVGKQDPAEKTDSWLFSEKEWSDFTLEVEFKVPEKCNSGIAIRMPKEATGDPDMHGYEVQICDVPGKKPTGSLLHHIDSTTNNVHKPNEWNRMVITCEGDHIVVMLNDLKVIDTKQKGPKAGRIGMQIPKGKEFADQVVHFRNIRVKDLAVKAAVTAPGPE